MKRSLAEVQRIVLDFINDTGESLETCIERCDELISLIETQQDGMKEDLNQRGDET